MGVRSFLVLLSLVGLTAFTGCSKDPTQVVPETRGKRGENCQARNDCETGLACLNGICSKNEFDVDVAAKHCDRIECTETADCCGDKPTKAPKECGDRDKYCLSTFPGCSPSLTCTSDSQCGSGTCRAAGTGTCVNGVAALSCTSVAACRDTCAAGGTCTLSGVTCAVDSECSYYDYNSTVTCVLPTRTCDCANPDYAPGNSICSNPDCTDLCLLRCEDDRCVTDHSCGKDADCISAGLPYCDQGRCVTCKSDDDCGMDETCEEGVCHKPCEHNEECALFEECNKKSGECEYVGCKSDRECILAASGNSETPQSVSTSSGEDARLSKCLPSEADPKVSTCKIPCENDGSCGSQSVCDKGYCKFIGCESDEECRAYLGITNQMPTEAKPFVVTAVCRE